MEQLSGKVGVVTGAASGIGRAVARGKDPAEVADMVVEGIRTNRFWLLTHPAWNDVMLERARALATDGHLHTGFGG